jgi:muramoyltetrapeptide carboxypeptidase
MIEPASLQPGNTIGIVATGRKINTEAITHADGIIRSFGFEVRLGQNLFSNKHSYLSGLDSERLNDLQSMLDDPAIKVILCARGGYGTTRILDQLDFTAFLKNPKWICGFSDITALHLNLQSLGVKSIHGTMPILFPNSESNQSIKSLFNVLKGERQTIDASFNNYNIQGKATGKLIGGNLSLITDSLGTNAEIDTKEKILVIEEVDEHLYKIDRMMVQLKRANKLQELAGLVVGHMTDMKDTELPFGETVNEIILNHTKGFGFPVGFNFPIGHENPNLAWVEGATGTLSVTTGKSLLKF